MICSSSNQFALIFFSFTLLFSVSACSSPSTNKNSSSGRDSSMPKEFGTRFSSENIKKEREAYYLKKLSMLKRLNPTVEVQKAVLLNDFHYLVSTFDRAVGVSVLGLTEDEMRDNKCKFKSVEGMGDVLYGSNHINYRKEMIKYMTEFNILMKAYCG